MSEILLRDYTEEDWPYITNSSFRGIADGYDDTTVLDLPAIEAHLNMLHQFWKENATIKIACSKEFQHVIAGYIVYIPQDTSVDLWYLNVKHPYRRMGVASLLVETFLSEYSRVKFYLQTRKYWEWRNGKMSKESEEFLSRLRLSEVYQGISSFVHGGE